MLFAEVYEVWDSQTLVEVEAGEKTKWDLWNFASKFEEWAAAGSANFAHLKVNYSVSFSFVPRGYPTGSSPRTPDRLRSSQFGVFPFAQIFS
jgi:hypothetical protein